MSETVTNDAGGEGAKVIAELEEHEFKSGSWFTKLVTRYLHHYYTRRAKLVVTPGEQHEAALRAVRWACVKSALSGAASGSLVTGATLLVGTTEGMGALVAIPAAAAGIGLEMVFRTIVHVELTCKLADIFGLTFDVDDQGDLWRLYALVFDTEEHEEGSDDPGRDLVERVLEVDEEVGKEIGSALIGESVLRNVVPFVGIASSSITNWRKTRALGDTLRRYMRYQRALTDAMTKAEEACATVLDLLVEGLWFVFTADGKLSDEEAATLAWMLKRFDEKTRAEISSRFVEDELPWMDRLSKMPAAVREDFYHALEVAAAVDKSVTLPERRILRHAAKHLGVTYDEERVRKMVTELEEHGVLAERAPAR